MKFLFGNWKSNLRKLEACVGELRAARGEIENEVVEAQRNGEVIQQDVQLWLTNVDEVTAKTDQFFEDESQAQQNCLHQLCPNLTIHHRLSKKFTTLLQEVADVYEKRRELPAVSCGILLQESSGDYLAFQSRMTTVQQIMDELKNPNTVRIGVYGTGGVGKTILIKEVCKQATNDKSMFQVVVLVEDVKNIQEPKELQKIIVQKLGMPAFENLFTIPSSFNSEVIILDKNKIKFTMQERAILLRKKIHKKSTLVILDDIWEQIDLEAVGITSSPTCKILLTSTSSKALSDMSTQKEFRLDILKEEESWGLFEHRAGDVVKDPTVRTIAKQVAKRCGGLPLLIVTFASALKGRTTLPLWEDALTYLQKGSDREGALREKAYLGLEWCYNQLNDYKELKPLFLLCGFTSNGNDIVLTDLLKYTMGLGFFENPCTLEQSRNTLHSWVEKLEEYCLVGTEDKKCVKMNELVRDVANRIAIRDKHILLSMKDGGACELNNWPDKGFLEKCTTISIPRSNSKLPRLPEVMQCPTLQMFLLHSNYSLEIPPRFFEEMIQLKLLSLKSNCRWSLPKSLQVLENLRTLCLGGKLKDISLVGHLRNLEILSFEGSDVKKLPKEIGQLSRLRLLDLSNCYELQVISPGVLSSLGRLEELRMRNSFDFRESVERKRSGNASLSELQHLCHLTALEIHVRDAHILPADFFSHKLERFDIVIGKSWYWDGEEHKTLNTLKLDLTTSIKLDHGLKLLLNLCQDLSLNGSKSVNHIIHQLDTEDLQQLKHLHLQKNVDFTYINNKKVFLPNLTTLCVERCKDLRFLFTWSMAKYLVHLKILKISECQLMEEIVASTREHDGNMADMFSKLEVLKLDELENLARFCTGSYIEFPNLKKLKIQGCKKLKSFINMKPEVKRETVVDFLFDDKVGFPNLERLRIMEAGELKTIWHIQLAQHSFRRLRQVVIHGCDSLTNIFPQSFMRRLNALETLDVWDCRSLEVLFELKGSNAQETHQDSHDHQLNVFYLQNVVSISIGCCTRLRNIFPFLVAKGLQNLCELTVRECDGVVEIVGEEEDGVFKTSPLPHFVFPKVKSLDFSFLPELKSFYPRMHTSKWPLLKTLVLLDGKKVKSFAAQAKLSIFPEKHEPEPLMFQQSLFLIDEGSFQNLEHLNLESMEIWNGPLPAEPLFGKLKSIEFCSCAAFSNLPFLASAPNLEKIEVTWDDSEEIFVAEEESSVGSSTLIRARCLKLYGMDNLMYLGKKNSQSAGCSTVLVFPNLEILEVESCSTLKNLWSSSISFQNLTTLKVARSEKLEYLTTYSVAKSLVQLTTLEVEYCESMVVLVASDGEDDAGNGIAFIRLQRLKLSSLPRLQDFCSGKRIVIFPSSMTFIVDHCNQFKVTPEWVRIMDPIQEKPKEDNDDKLADVETESYDDDDDEDDDDEQKGEDKDDDDRKIADVDTVGHDDEQKGEEEDDDDDDAYDSDYDSGYDELADAGMP